MSAPQTRRGHDVAGFTLVEVLVAVAILALSMTTLLRSQMEAMSATRHAQRLTSMAFLAESKLIDIEFELKQDGWGDADKEFEGDFSEEGWPDSTYECVVDMIEMPDYTQLQQAADAADEADGGIGGVDVQDTGEQAFDSLGVVWPVVKGAVERSIRKATCTVYWKEGKIKQDFAVSTFWTDPTKLIEIPEAGGEVDEEDDTNPDDGGGGATPNGGRGPGGAPGGGAAAGPGGKGGIGGAKLPGGR